MSIKKYIPGMTESVKIAVVVTILAVTGIGAMITAKAGSLIGRR